MKNLRNKLIKWGLVSYLFFIVGVPVLFGILSPGILGVGGSILSLTLVLGCPASVVFGFYLAIIAMVLPRTSPQV